VTATAPLLAIAAATGLVLGSYAVTAALRFSRGQGSMVGGSRCDACGGGLGFAQTIPIVSYVGLRGVCAACGARIDVTHLLGELAGVLVLVAAVWAADLPRAALLSVLGLALLAAATIDARIRRLPNGLTVAAAAAGLALAWTDGVTSLVAGGLAAAGTAAVLLGLRAARGRRGDPGLGLGDVKLLTALALWLGVSTPFAVLVACGLGLATAPWLRDAEGRLAFGPMIALSGWVVGIAAERGWTPWTF
jgi:leader peptidase (prepilin peptidase)/N-methyltransferase